MPLVASFGDLKFKNVAGYRISTCMAPLHGIGDHFYVYILDRQDADEPFSNPIELGTAGPGKEDTLQLSDGYRSYKFKDIYLNSAEAGATRRERFRFVEFRYTRERIDSTSSPVTLSNQAKDELEAGSLGDDYTYHLGSGKEQLLGFDSRISAVDAIVLRFSALRNSQNSFLEKIVEVNSGQADGNKMSSFKIGFSRASGNEIEVTADNLKHVFVEESYGELKRQHLPDLTSLIAAGSSGELARLRFSAISDDILLKHDASPEFREADINPQTVETATFIFQPGKLRDKLKIN